MDRQDDVDQYPSEAECRNRARYSHRVIRHGEISQAEAEGWDFVCMAGSGRNLLLLYRRLKDESG